VFVVLNGNKLFEEQWSVDGIGAVRLAIRNSFAGHMKSAMAVMRFGGKQYGIALLICAWLYACSALMGQEVHDLTPAEQFVLRTIQDGKEADLTNFSPSATRRILGHEFLEQLLTGAYGKLDTRHRSIRVRNAVLQERLDVSNQEIPYVVWLRDCIFEQGVEFSGARFARDLSFEHSSFGPTPLRGQNPPFPAYEDRDNHALFIGMQVDGSLDLTRTTFYVPADFTYAQVSDQFLFDNVSFLSAGYADFEGLKTKEPAFFREDHFEGPVSLTDAEPFELFFEDNTFNSRSAFNAPDLSVTQAQIGRELSIKNTAFRWLEARYLSLQGPAVFDGVTVSKKLSLAHSQFRTLTIERLEEWREIGTLDVDLEGLSFEGVDVPEAKVEDYASRMLSLLNSDRCKYYSPQPYMELEKFLRSHGNSEKADETYISMRRRERRELAWWKWTWDWLLDKLVGYGRKPWRAAFYSLLAAVLGMFIFRRGCMESTKKKEPADSRYSPFWYSLDLLAPVIDLGPAKEWSPDANHNGMQKYAYFQRLVGWFLIPLVVGAITGIIK
jgi:hypothetical protein